MTTKEILADMLTENTGRHFLDSGGAYGRHWERNQTAVLEKQLSPVEVFEAQPPITWDYGPTLNVFHFLNAALEYAESLDRAWFKWVFSGPEDRYINGIETANEFIGQLVEKGWCDPNWEFHNSWQNSYNSEDALSQVIQYVMFKLTDKCPWEADTPSWTDGEVVLLSIHGGCDVRGGYTSLRAFAHNPYDGDGPSLFDNAQITLYCSNDECKTDKWGQKFFADSDDAGYSWYSDFMVTDDERWDGKFGERDWPADTKEYIKEQAIPLCPICGNELSPGGRCW